MSFKLLGAMLIAIFAGLVSCKTAPSHESFVGALNSSVGRSVDSYPLSNKCHPSLPSFVRIIVLPNGHEEHKHIRPPIRNVGPCAYSCEVDPRTGKVLAVRVEGSETDCVDFP